MEKEKKYNNDGKLKFEGIIFLVGERWKYLKEYNYRGKLKF